VVISQGEVWWADLPDPTLSGPGFRRPVVVTLDKALLTERTGRLPRAQLALVLTGIDVLLGR
jgi:mRNA-degrading endonuclease toxin of MazEF toxin-antitoxin module